MTKFNNSHSVKLMSVLSCFSLTNQTVQSMLNMFTSVVKRNLVINYQWEMKFFYLCGGIQFLKFSHKNLNGGGGSSGGWGCTPDIGDWRGGKQQLVGGAVYIHSCQHTAIYNNLARSCTPILHLYLREGGYPHHNMTSVFVPI